MFTKLLTVLFLHYIYNWKTVLEDSKNVIVEISFYGKCKIQS